MKRIHIANYGPDELNIKTALRIAFEECQSRKVDELAIITPKKDNLDHLVIADVIGRDVAELLVKGKKVEILDTGIFFSNYSVATVQKGTTPKVGLAFYLVSEYIKKLDALRFDCLIFVPWLEEEGKEWAAKWNAETHGEARKESPVEQ